MNGDYQKLFHSIEEACANLSNASVGSKKKGGGGRKLYCFILFACDSQLDTV